MQAFRGGSCLREMKASTTNKRRGDIIYTSKMIVKKAKIFISHRSLLKGSTFTTRYTRGNRRAIPVRAAEQTRHSIASSLEGKWKNRSAQCHGIPPNTTPKNDTKKIYVTPFPSCFEEYKVGTFISPILKSSVTSMETHLPNRKKQGMTKAKVRRIKKVRAKRNGIIIVQQISLETLLKKVKMGRDCQSMVLLE